MRLDSQGNNHEIYTRMAELVERDTQQDTADQEIKNALTDELPPDDVPIFDIFRKWLDVGDENVRIQTATKKESDIPNDPEDKK